MTEMDKMLHGELYNAADPELTKLRITARKLCRQYNDTDEDRPEELQQLLHRLLPNSEEIPDMQAPIHFDYGCNTSFGTHCYTNFNFVCLDVCPVHIGSNVLFGPNVTIATPMHPLLPEERNLRTAEDGSLYSLEYAKPITIQDDCWIAANVVICGGVTIGRGTVIGAGSVVTRDIPSAVVAAGNPCRALRAITDLDRMERGQA